MDLIGAVSSGDSAKATSIVDAVKSDPEAVTDEADDVEGEVEADADLEPLVDTDDAEGENVETNTLSRGDAVTVDGQPGVVKIPRSGNGKIGVLVNGKLRMVDAVDDATVNEAMAFPDLSRILALAGVSTAPAVSVVASAKTTAPEPSCEVGAYNPTKCTAEQAANQGDDVMMTLMATLADAESMIPKIRMADAGTVRQKINAMMGKLNESFGVRARKL
jgi:hypothetical protein